MNATLHKNAISCNAQDSLFDAARTIRDNKVRHVYVVDDGKLVGVLGSLDINNKVIAEGKEANGLQIKDIMNEVKSVTVDQPLEYAYAIMRNFNTFTCPVVDADGILVGFYTFEEVCDAIHKKINGEEQ